VRLAEIANRPPSIWLNFVNEAVYRAKDLDTAQQFVVWNIPIGDDGIDQVDTRAQVGRLGRVDTYIEDYVNKITGCLPARDVEVEFDNIHNEGEKPG
jgi:hypothetical protein